MLIKRFTLTQNEESLVGTDHNQLPHPALKVIVYTPVAPNADSTQYQLFLTQDYLNFHLYEKCIEKQDSL